MTKLIAVALLQMGKLNGQFLLRIDFEHLSDNFNTGSIPTSTILKQGLRSFVVMIRIS